MAIIIVHDSLAYHKKTDEFIKLSGVSRADAIGHLIILWSWCSEKAKDGILPRMTDVEIASTACYFGGDPKKFVDALVGSGFLDRTPGALQVHDWEDWMSDEVYEKVRYERRRSGGNSEEKRRKNGGKTAENSGSPHPSSPVVVSFPVSGGGGDWPLTEDYVHRLTELYPGIDVILEAKKALNWVEINPSKKKTAGGMKRFLATWMERSQNSGRGQRSFSSTDNASQLHEDMEKRRASKEKADKIIAAYQNGKK